MAVAEVYLLGIEARARRIAVMRRRARLGTVAGTVATAGLLALTLRTILVHDTDWQRITAAGVLRAAGRFALVDVRLFPELLRPALETLVMAALGTVAGAVIALPVAWLGARNVTPLGHASYLLARTLMTLSRSVHEIVWGLLFVAAAGLGTLAGILAMAVRSVGFISKTVAEAVEDADPGPIDAMRAVGANRLQILRYGILPQVVPVLLGNVIFEWDVNVRRSTVLGLVGAGGLGLAMHRQMAAYNYGGLAAVIVVIFAIILLGEVVSRHARRAIL